MTLHMSRVKRVSKSFGMIVWRVPAVKRAMKLLRRRDLLARPCEIKNMNGCLRIHCSEKLTPLYFEHRNTRSFLKSIKYMEYVCIYMYISERISVLSYLLGLPLGAIGSLGDRNRP